MIKSILAAKFWIPLSRINYVAFLIHVDVLLILYHNIESPIHYTSFTTVRSSTLIFFVINFHARKLVPFNFTFSLINVNNSSIIMRSALLLALPCTIIYIILRCFVLVGRRDFCATYTRELIIFLTPSSKKISPPNACLNFYISYHQTAFLLLRWPIFSPHWCYHILLRLLSHSLWKFPLQT